MLRKYKLSDLNVAHYKNKYIICASTNQSFTFLEVFTNEKLVATWTTSLEPLSWYYSKNEKQNTKISKKELIDKYNEINNFYNNKAEMIKKNENTLNKCKSKAEIELEKVVRDFFPKTGEWSSHEFSKDENCLICHLRDGNWLASKLQKEFNLTDIDFIEIYDFVKTSELFKQLRHEYEQKIVKWQIEFMKNGGEGWCIDEEYGGDITLYTEFCDLGFRKGVVDTLLAIGMDKEAIEEGLEKNAHLWRDFYIQSAFDNKFNPIMPSFFGYNKANLDPIDPVHKEKWIKLRKYEYYQQHELSVRRYGTIEDDMQLSQEEVWEIRNYLYTKDKERLKHIDYAKQKRKF